MHGWRIVGMDMGIPDNSGDFVFGVPMGHAARVAYDADMVMLRALYLSWRKARLETPMQRAFGILAHTPNRTTAKEQR